MTMTLWLIVNTDQGSWLDNQDKNDRLRYPDKNFKDCHVYNDWHEYSDRGWSHTAIPWTTKDCYGYNDKHGYTKKGCFHIDNPWKTKDCHGYSDSHGYSDKGFFHIENPWTTKDCHGYSDRHGNSDGGWFHIDNPWTTTIVMVTATCMDTLSEVAFILTIPGQPRIVMVSDLYGCSDKGCFHPWTTMDGH